MRNIPLFPVMGKDDLNYKILQQQLHKLFPLPPANFEELLARLREAEKKQERKDH